MSIWVYESGQESEYRSWDSHRCEFCDGSLRTLHSEPGFSLAAVPGLCGPSPLDPSGGGSDLWNGRVRGLPGFPGDYELIVSSESGIYRHPSVVRIESGQTTLVEVVVELVSGTVTLVDEGGEPMVGVTVLFAWADDPEHPINFETTSEAGELSLTLSPGNYILIVWAPEAAGETQEWIEHEVWIEWTRGGSNGGTARSSLTLSHPTAG